MSDTMILTGLTQKEWEKREARGHKPTCYLCKRSETDRAAVIVNGKHVSYKPIQLFLYDIFKNDEMSFSVLLCPECSLLLNYLTETKAAHSTEVVNCN